MQHSFDVSVILPFADDEDVIGTAVRRLSTHLREYGATFEIIAVDEDSGDNSHAVLALLRKDIEELRIASAPGRGRGFAQGAQRARGKALWLIEPRATLGALAPFGRAHRRVSRGELDAAVVGTRFAVVHRTRMLPVLDGVRGIGAGFLKRIGKRAAARGRSVEMQVIGGSAGPTPHRLSPRPFARLLGALSASRW